MGVAWRKQQRTVSEGTALAAILLPTAYGWMVSTGAYLALPGGMGSHIAGKTTTATWPPAHYLFVLVFVSYFTEVRRSPLPELCQIGLF